MTDDKEEKHVLVGLRCNKTGFLSVEMELLKRKKGLFLQITVKTTNNLVKADYVIFLR